jgi:hypothetical protein
MKQVILEFGKDHPIFDNIENVENLRIYLNKRLKTETFEELQKSIQEEFFVDVKQLKNQGNPYNVSTNVSAYDGPQTWFKEFNQLDREYYPILLDLPERMVNEETSQPDIAIEETKNLSFEQQIQNFPKIDAHIYDFIWLLKEKIKIHLTFEVVNTLWAVFNTGGWNDPTEDLYFCMVEFMNKYEPKVALEKRMKIGSKILLLNGDEYEVAFFTKITGDKLKHPEANWFVGVKGRREGFFFNDKGQQSANYKYDPQNIVSIDGGTD